MELVWIALGTIILAACANQAAHEFRSWTPKIVAVLIQIAVRKLPSDKRARYREEWSGFVADVPGELGKVIAAAGLLVAARRMAGGAALHDRCVAAAVLLVIAPVMLTVAVYLKLANGGPILSRTLTGIRPDGTPLYETLFRTAATATWFERFLVRVALHELPKFWDVLRGDARLPKFLRELSPDEPAS